MFSQEQSEISKIYSFRILCLLFYQSNGHALCQIRKRSNNSSHLTVFIYIFFLLQISINALNFMDCKFSEILTKHFMGNRSIDGNYTQYYGQLNASYDFSAMKELLLHSVERSNKDCYDPRSSASVETTSDRCSTFKVNFKRLF